MKFKLLLNLLIIALLSSCTHSLHLVHVSEFSPAYKSYQSGDLVKARAEQFTVMGFVYDTNYVDQAYAQLQSQCSNGTIQGITTQYSTSHGFFSWTNVIDMQGLCIK